jgi:hypothetical protein
MSTTLQHQGEILRLLRKAKPPVVKAVIRTASPKLISALCECCHNVLKGHVPLSRAQKQRLSRYRAGLRTITKNKLSVKKKKQILQQGGFLGALLGPIVKVLGSVLGL